MVYCIVKGCKNRPERKMEGITFHRVPFKSYDLWMKILKIDRSNMDMNNNQRVCSQHFETKWFYSTSKGTHLWLGAVPTLLLFETDQTPHHSPKEKFTTKDNKEFFKNVKKGQKKKLNRVTAKQNISQKPIKNKSKSTVKKKPIENPVSTIEYVNMDLFQDVKEEYIDETAESVDNLEHFVDIKEEIY